MNESKDEKVKMPTKKYWGELDTIGKIKYFFQYYKWFVLGAVFVLVFAFITVQQFSSAVSPDMTLIIMGNTPVTEANLYAMNQALIPYATDVTGDTKITPKIIQLTYLDRTSKNYNAEVDNGNDINLNLQTGMGNPLIFVLSPAEYARVSTGEFTFPFKDISTLTTKSKDGKTALLKDTKLFTMPGFSALPNNYVVCMLDKTSNLKKDYADAIQQETENAFVKLIQ